MLRRRLLEGSASGEGGGGGGEESEDDDKTSLLFESMIVLFSLVLASIIFHTITHWLQHAVRRSLIGPSFLQAVYRELSLLGMISFFLFVISFSGVLSSHSKEVIEEIHMTLFIASLYYILFIIFLLLSSAFWVRRMQKLEYKVHQLESRPKTSLWMKIKKWISLRQVIIKSEYSLIRQAVVTQHQLPEDFNFSAYIGVQLQRNLLHIIEIDWKLWLATAFFFVIAIVLEEIKHAFTVDDATKLYIFFNCAMTVFTAGLIVKLRFVIVNMAKWKPETIKPIDDTAYDRKVARTWKRQLQKGWCPCTQQPPHNTAKNFWFSSRGLFRGLLQLVILFQAVNLAIFSLMSGEISHRLHGAGVAVVIICTLFIIVIAIPYTVPVFALAASSGEYADRPLLRLLLQKHREGILSSTSFDSGATSGQWWKMNHQIFSEPRTSVEMEMRQPADGTVNHDLEAPLLTGQYQPPSSTSSPSPY